MATFSDIKHKPGSHHGHLLELAKPFPPVKTAVVHPCSSDALIGALEAARHQLITPIFLAPKKKLLALALETEVDISAFELIDVAHSHAAADKAVEMVRENQVDMVMKGSLHTDELVHSVLTHQGGIRTDKRLTHVFFLDVPNYHKPLFLTDCAINIYPDLMTKADIVQQAIYCAQAVGIKKPKVAILSAIETINTKIQSTIDAAALCKMADRGQITGGVLDGPLAFDNAISEEAALEKGIRSEVAGHADIFLAPNLESGNMLAKELGYIAGATTCGLALGATVPIVLTSRSDTIAARVYSSALGQLYTHARMGPA